MVARVDIATDAQFLDTTGAAVPLRVRARSARPTYAARKAALVVVDALAVALAMAVAYAAGAVQHLPPSRRAYLALGAAAIPWFLVVFARYGLYASRRVSTRAQECARIFHAVAFGVAGLVIASYASEVRAARRWLLLTFVFAFVFVVAEREVARRTFRVLRRRGRCRRPIVVVGANGEARALATMLGREPELGYDVVGFVADDVDAWRGGRLLGTIDDTLRIARRERASGVLIATTALDAERCNDLAREALDAGLYVELSSALCDVASERLVVRPLGRYPVVSLRPVNRRGWRAAAKRAFDVVCAATLLVLSAPLLGAAAVAVELDSPGPVLFRQRRVGKDGKTFTIVKLRTMTTDAEARLPALLTRNEVDGPLFKMRDDPRVTRVGRRLRRWSVDEIPQLWNVLRGEMSMVGPRPALASEVAGWPGRLHDRLRVKPGLTGMWQVSGRSNASFDDYTRLDLYYVDNWSLISDLVIVAQTVPTVLRRRGAC
jgi:exopolysaccharide biosynthesis polyprenyl glycosylphosphotransferase